MQSCMHAVHAYHPQAQPQADNGVATRVSVRGQAPPGAAATASVAQASCRAEHRLQMAKARSFGHAQVMVPLRSCLELASDKSQKMLRAKALECISLVGMAVGKDIFREDAHAVMRFMQLMQARAGTVWHL